MSQEKVKMSFFRSQGEDREDLEKTKSLIEATGSVEEIVKGENTIKSQIYNSMPLYPTGAYGRSKRTQVVNLSTNTRPLIAYACSHLIITFDYISRKKKCWPGHKNTVTSLSSDSLGKWLISSDYGHGNLIIVWNLEHITPFSKFQTPPGTFISKISPCGKYIVSVSSEDGIYSCHLWLISGKTEEAAGSVSFDAKHGTVINIAFSFDYTNLFMVTTKRAVLFFTWHNERKKNLKPGNLEIYIPPPLPEVLLENLQESIYLQHYPLCFTSMPNGYILVWNDEGYNFKPKKYISQTNKKTLQKWYKLQNSGIKVLRQLNEYVVAGDDLGVIRFYDYNLRLIYWTECKNMTVNMVQIEMHLEAREYFIQKTTSVRSNDQFTDKSLPTDCTREGDVFIIQDFIVVDFFGSVYYFDYLKDNCFKICDIPSAPVTSIDVHPERPIITTGDTLGVLTMINYMSEEFIHSKSVSDFTDDYNNAITCVKYSSSGGHIAIGMEKGAVFFVDSCLYKPAQKKPFALSSTKIFKMCFSPDDKYMAYADEHYCITLYGSVFVTTEKESKKEWICCGRVCSHYKKISDLKFVPYPTDRNRLFSIALDRSLVEYRLNIRKNDGIGIITTDLIEQTAYPISLTCSIKVSGEKYLLITNSEFKYKLYHQKTKQYHQTILGPVYDSPISYSAIINDEMIIFGTNKTIGLQILPLDGNPFKTMGVIAHPTEIIAIAYETHRRMIFTVGNDETCVLIWNINERPLKMLHKQGGEGLEPYIHMIEGGAKGPFLQQAKDYFYLGKVLHQGLIWKNQQDSLPSSINACDIADVLRSLGHYPTEKEIEEIKQEVFLNVYKSERKEPNTVSFEDLIRLYVNHRPARGITSKQVGSSLKVLSEGDSFISKEKLQKVLTEEGEIRNRSEISTYLQLLFDISLSQNFVRNASLETTGDLSQHFTQATIEDKLLGIPKYEDAKM